MVVRGIGMKKLLLGTAMVAAAFAASTGSGGAATLDDVMARLDSLQRDNQAMRKEIATLRQNNSQAPRQAAVPANAPSRALPANISTAMAADMPSRGYYKSVPVEGPYNWTGFYAGANAGYAAGRETSAFASVDGLGVPFSFGRRVSYDGLFGGGQLGYNLQMSNFVFGVEADIQFADIGGLSRAMTPPPGSFAASNKLDAFGTVRGRLGYAFGNFMPYVTGGFAAGRNTFTFTAPLAGLTASDSAIQTGWTAGAGLEYGVSGGWTVRAEYLHVDLGSGGYLPDLIPAITFPTTSRFDLVRGAVNYRF
jgi:outer membrane immunogenic protein